MFSALPITPRYKMLLSYDIKNGMHSIYYRYVVSEFVPSLNEMGVYVTEAWHTAYATIRCGWWNMWRKTLQRSTAC